MVKVKKTLEMHGWKSLGPRLASLHGLAENIKKHSRSFKLGWATIHNNKHFPGGDCLQRRQNCRTVVQLTAHLNLKEAEAKIATTFCFAFFCASHSFGKLSSDSPPRYDFVRFSPAIPSGVHLPPKIADA